MPEKLEKMVVEGLDGKRKTIRHRPYRSWHFYRDRASFERTARSVVPGIQRVMKDKTLVGYISRIDDGVVTVRLSMLDGGRNLQDKECSFTIKFARQYGEVSEGKPVGLVTYIGRGGFEGQALIPYSKEATGWIILRPGFDYSRFRKK